MTQPWATLVILGRKKFETRSWSTRHRGALVIHASKTFPRDAREFAEALGLSDLPLGSILGVVDLVDCQPTQYCPGRFTEAEYGDFSWGRWAWTLETPRELETPIPWKGALGLWKLPEGALDARSWVNGAPCSEN